MFAPALTPAQTEFALARHENAHSILADMERQYACTIPPVWRETITSLLLRALTDPDLHKIMTAILTIEHEAGRYTPPGGKHP